MSPALGYMDSRPHQSYIMPGRQHHQPMPDEVTPQLGINPSVFPAPHEPLPYPYAGNCSYPVPCHSCYNYMATPSYYHGAPYPHFFQPPPFHCWGPYPGNAEPSAGHNELPYRPAYPMEQPYAVQHHCCGCPNHVCDPKNEKGVKIEEHESLDSDKKGKSYPESLVPAYRRNFPYPVVWIPHENSRNKEQGTHAKPRIVDLDTASQEKKPALSSLQKEPGWNGWFPLFMGNYDHPKPVGEKKRSPNQHVRDDKRNYQFPVIWIPSSDKQEEAEAENEPQANILESPESNFKVFPPMQIHDNRNKTSDGGPQQNKRTEVSSHHQDAENTHLKHIEPCEGKTNSRDSQEEAANALNKETTDTPVDRVPGSDARKSSSSLTKTSKLPPVCLRVDPLPRKKGRNGSSRSPSLPGSEAKSQSSSVASFTDSNGQNSPAQSLNRTSEDQPKRKVKVIEVKGGIPTPSDNNSRDLQSSLQVQYPQKIKENNDRGGKEEVFQIKEDGGATIAGDEGTEKRTKELEALRTLSDEEAAVRIQSAYRGFQVRKWETLKKLKQMARVRDEVTKARKSIKELASSYDTSPEEGKFERQKVLIGESIMNLLLRLDTIQGLHPELRDIRKSLARELVALQEELDSLTMKNLDESLDNPDIARNDEGTVSKNSEEAQRQFEESLSVSENSSGQLESNDLKLLKADNTVSETSENACLGSIDGQTQVTVEDLKSEPSEFLDVESQQAALQHCSVQDYRHLNEIDGEPPLVSIMGPTGTNPEHPTGEKDERLELATVEKSNYDAAVEDESWLASVLGNGSNTKIEFMSEDQGTSALQPLSQADEEKGTLGATGMEPDTFTSPTFYSGADGLISHGREPDGDAASKIHIAEGNVADYVLSEHDQFGEVDPVLNGHDKWDQGSDDVTSPENFDKMTIESKQVEVPKTMTSDWEVVDNVHEEQPIAPGPDDFSPASNGAEQDQEHEDGTRGESLLPPRLQEAQLGMLGPTVETCRDVNEDKAIVSADLSCDFFDRLNGEAASWEKEELTAGNVKNIDLKTHFAEQVDEREDNHQDEEVVAPENSISDESAEQVEQSPSRGDDSNVNRPMEEMEGNEKLIKENEKLREMMEKLMEAGKQQLHVISELTGKVKDLERRLPRNKRVKSRCRMVAGKPRSSHAKSCADSVN